MKKLIALLSVAALMISLSACNLSNETTATETSSQTLVNAAETDRSGTTVVGKVTSINGSVVSLQLGELSENTGAPEMPTGSSEEKPSGNSEQPENGENGNASAPSETGSGESNAQGQPPEIPSGDSQGTPPEKPSGENGEAPSGGPGGTSFTAGEETASVDLSTAKITKNSESITMSDIKQDDILKITFDENNFASVVEVVTTGTGGAPGGSFGGSGEVTQGESANTIDKDGEYSNETYESDGDDENALRIDSASVTLESISVNKNGGKTSNTEDGDFYGMNAALLATNGATVTIKNAEVTSSAQNGNGVFSYGSGTTVNISDSKITTSADNSGGIQTTGGGTTNAENLKVKTSGNSSAAIRSDRGGGTVNVDKGTYTSNGYNSPAVYSTADITVKNSTLTANNSEALVIEGKNSIMLENCDVTGNMSDTKGSSSDENVHNVMIYQSMSGDADVGTSTFKMTGGSLTSNNGDMFYITNTHSVISLSDVEISNKDSEAYLMNICGNSASHGWGSAGSNGAQVEFTADNQVLSGSIIVDKISTLDFKLTGKSEFNGTINIVENKENGTAVSDNAVVIIESGSTWNLTGDCVITSLENNGTINFNGYTITLADGTVLK